MMALMMCWYGYKKLRMMESEPKTV
jgi:Ca2+-binding EF-hand superfamily protein